MSKNTGVLQVATYQESNSAIYHPSYELSTRYLGKNNPNIPTKTKGTCYYLKQTDKWYFKPAMKVPKYEIVDGVETLVVETSEVIENGVSVKVETPVLVENQEFFRVDWWNLDVNVEVGFFGYGIYKGENPAIKGVKGELHLTKNLDWTFTAKIDGKKELFRLKNPESVEII